MRVIFTFLLFSCLSVTARAQSFTDYVSGQISVPTLLSVTLSNNTATASFSDIAAYQNGLTTTNFSSLAIKSNILWLLNVQALNEYFTPMTSGGSTTMPASILSMKLNGTSTFYPLSTGGFTLKTGSRGNAQTAGNSFGVDMNFNPGFSYPGGIYSMGILYTLTNQ